MRFYFWVNYPFNAHFVSKNGRIISRLWRNKKNVLNKQNADRLAKDEMGKKSAETKVSRHGKIRTLTFTNPSPTPASFFCPRFFLLSLFSFFSQSQSSTDVWKNAPCLQVTKAIFWWQDSFHNTPYSQGHSIPSFPTAQILLSESWGQTMPDTFQNRH